MTQIFDANPCEVRALSLRTSLNQSLISSLSHLLEACEDVLLPDLYLTCVEKLASLNVEKKFSSFLYALNAMFLQAYTAEDISTIQKIAKNIAEHHFQIDHINFLSTSAIAPYHRELFEKYSVFELPGEVTFTNSTPYDHQKMISLVQQGLILISQTCPELFKEITTFVSEIITFESPQVKVGSSFNLFGLIYFRESLPYTIVNVIDSLAHETGHLYLFSLSSNDALILNPPEDRYSSPLRKDKRPLIGIYHASFVISRILYALKALYNHKVLKDGDQAYCAQLIEDYKVKYASGFEVVQKHGKMTTLGESILNSSIKLAS